MPSNLDGKPISQPIMDALFRDSLFFHCHERNYREGGQTRNEREILEARLSFEQAREAIRLLSGEEAATRWERECDPRFTFCGSRVMVIERLIYEEGWYYREEEDE